MKRIQENEFGFKKDIGSRDRSIDVDEYNLSIGSYGFNPKSVQRNKISAERSSLNRKLKAQEAAQLKHKSLTKKTIGKKPTSSERKRAEEAAEIEEHLEAIKQAENRRKKREVSYLLNKLN